MFRNPQQCKTAGYLNDKKHADGPERTAACFSFFLLAFPGWVFWGFLSSRFPFHPALSGSPALTFLSVRPFRGLQLSPSFSSGPFRFPSPHFSFRPALSGSPALAFLFIRLFRFFPSFSFLSADGDFQLIMPPTIPPAAITIRDFSTPAACSFGPPIRKESSRYTRKYRMPNISPHRNF